MSLDITSSAVSSWICESRPLPGAGSGIESVPIGIEADAVQPKTDERDEADLRGRKLTDLCKIILRVTRGDTEETDEGYPDEDDEEDDYSDDEFDMRDWDGEDDSDMHTYGAASWKVGTVYEKDIK